MTRAELNRYRFKPERKKSRSARDRRERQLCGQVFDKLRREISVERKRGVK